MKFSNCSGFDELVKKGFCEKTNIREGELPFTYLGVTVTYKESRYGECKTLVNRITKPVSH